MNSELKQAIINQYSSRLEEALTKTLKPLMTSQDNQEFLLLAYYTSILPQHVTFRNSNKQQTS